MFPIGSAHALLAFLLNLSAGVPYGAIPTNPPFVRHSRSKMCSRPRSSCAHSKPPGRITI